MATFFDGIANLFSRLGTGADRHTAGTTWAVPLVSPQLIEAAYRSSWLVRKIHDLPPGEMTREGRLWQAEAKQIEALEALEKKLAVWPKLRVALTTARLHGGGAIIMGVRGDPTLPIVPSAIRKGDLRYLFVASRTQLSAPQGMELDPESPWHGEPKLYEIQGAGGRVLRLHPSRVVPFHGAPLPPGTTSLSRQDTFWGDPLWVSIKSAVENAETAEAAVATLLHEMKTDIVGIPGFTEMVATEKGEAIVAARIEALTRFKSMFNTLILDLGDGKDDKESWETRQHSFAQYPELLRHFLGVVAGAADIPVTRLLGEAPGGLQSTGKGEQDDFDRSIDGKQADELAPALARIDEVLIPSALGSRPAEVYYEFAPLRPVDATAASENEKREAETVSALHATGLIPDKALGAALANRLVESGRWPGLDKALEEAAAAGEMPGERDPSTPDPGPTDPAGPGAAALEQTADRMAQRGTITRDTALALLADAAPRPLYVQRKLLNADEVIAWARGQGFEDLLAAEEMHVTVAYSRMPVDWFKVGESYDWGGEARDGRLYLAPGGPRAVERLGPQGAVVLLFASSALTYRHGAIIEAGGSHDYPEYQPHVTLTYAPPSGLDLDAVVPYRGRLEFGPEIFEDIAAP